MHATLCTGTFAALLSGQLCSFLLRRKDILKSAFQHADEDRDNKLSFDEFKSAINNPLVMVDPKKGKLQP